VGGADGRVGRALGRWQVDSQSSAAAQHGSGESLARSARPAAFAFDELPRNVEEEEALMSRDHILHRVRTALGRSAGQEPPPPPPVRLRIPEAPLDARAASFIMRLEALAGKAQRAATPSEAREIVAAATAGKNCVASNSSYLAEYGISTLPGVRTGIRNVDELRDACEKCDIGITSADYALADTGTLVTIASPEEARLVSLLPPAHIAVVPVDHLL